LGTRYSCGEAICGNCTVIVDDEPVLSCVTPIDTLDGAKITTIKEVAEQDHPLIRAWLEENVSQCGFCQPGQIMTALALLNRNPNPSDEEIIAAMDNNYCRCGTYQRIRKAIRRASEMMAAGKQT
jgi:isoquinoline 1-oxidoreductase alpha subunit